jgi:hypothetical protein
MHANYDFDNRVSVTIKGGPSAVEIKTLPKHKKNPDIGEKKTVFSSNILVEQEDALSFDDQEEVHPNFSSLSSLADILSDYAHGLGECLCPL